MGDKKFEIFELDVGVAKLALSPLPGRLGTLEQDQTTISAWGATLIVSMVQVSEFKSDSFVPFQRYLQVNGIGFLHLPVRDYGAFDDDILWSKAIEKITPHFEAGGRVLFHCYGGCGRSGMAALRALIDFGWTAEDAFTQLRQTRPCAVETADQLRWATKGHLNWDKVRG